MSGPNRLTPVRNLDASLEASVIIPVYQAEKVLADQLAALTAQTFSGSWEVVIADNGSSDGSIRVAERFKSLLPSLKMVDASRVRGPSFARNTGASHARGRLLLFCDADDVVSPRWVEEMVAAAPTADLLAGTGISSRDPRDVIGHYESSQAGEVPAGFRFLPWNRSSNLAVDSAVFASVEGFDESRRIGEDVEFCWRTQLAGYSFAFADKAFVAYRDRDTLRAALHRQYVFGEAAPRLYEEFARLGAPAATWHWIARDVLRTIIASPRAVTSVQHRRNWLIGMAGAIGRSVGLARLRLGQSARR